MTCGFDVAVIGAGIAGASAAWASAEHGRVVLLEREDQPGFHSTGRSAGSLSLGHFADVVRRLAAASVPFLEAPPRGFAWTPLLSPRPVLYVAAGPEAARLDVHRADLARHIPDLALLAPAEALALCPVLDSDALAGALLEPHAWEMDVHSILHGFLSGFRARGGEIRLDARVTALERRDGAWTLHTSGGDLRAAVVVDAAGAWGDAVAALAGCRPLGLAVLKRTAVLVEAGDGVRAWPMVKVLGDVLYWKPDGGGLMVSPMDEMPEEPGDARAGEEGVAIAMERLARYTTLRPAAVTHRWAGHRTFAPDRCPVAGFNPEVPGFFWLVGQGGAGIKTAPALSRIAAALVAGLPFPPDLADRGITPGDLSATVPLTGDSLSGRGIPMPDYITPEGYRRIADEYDTLLKVERPRITAEVAYAASLGDRSENAEYIYGKKRLREIDRRLRYLMKRLESVEVVNPREVVADRVRFGAIVVVLDEGGVERAYRIVGEDETDPRQGWVSYKSPLGRALLGRQEGDEAIVDAPGGRRTFEVVAIRYG